VISLLGPTGLFSKVPPSVYTDAYTLIFNAMKQTGVSRILAVGAPYMPDHTDVPSFKARFANGFMRIVGSGIYADFEAIGKLFDGEKELRWTIARVGRLVDGEQAVRSGAVGSKEWGGNTSRNGAAEWMVEFVEGSMDQWVGEKPALWSS
jgi:hypothetical protein